MTVKSLKGLLKEMPDEGIVEIQWGGMWQELMADKARVVEVKRLKVKGEYIWT